LERENNSLSGEIKFDIQWYIYSRLISMEMAKSTKEHQSLF